MSMRVNKIFVSCFVVCLLVLNQGCVTISSWGLKQDRQEIAGEINRKEGELNRHTRSYITGAVDALSVSPDKSTEDIVALQLAQKAQHIVGLPQAGDKIHIEDVIAKNEIAMSNLNDRDEDVIELSRRKEILGHDLKDTEEKLISLGELKAKEQKEGFFDSLWGWLTGTFGIVGAIAVLVIGGLSLLPIITQFIGWIVSKIGLIAWLGITSSQMTSNIIRECMMPKKKYEQSMMIKNLAKMKF